MSESQPLKLTFVHGAGGTKSKWRTVIPAFEKNGGAFWDLPGHGEDTAEPCDSIEAYASAISEKITEPSIVVGHSMGGLIAIELGLNNPNVKAIVLAASGYELPVHPKIIQKLSEGVFPESVFRASYAKNSEAALIEAEKQELAESPTEIAKNDFEACDRYKAGENNFKKLEIPILAIAGDEDRLIPADAFAQMQAINAHVEPVTVEGAGHYIALEKPETFIKHLKRFKQKIERE